jgi:RNA methyltransferase, trmH family
MINSIANKAIKEIVALSKKASLRKEKGLFIAEGNKIFSELSHTDIDRIYISEAYFAGMSEETKTILEKTEYYLVSDRVFKDISDTVSPQGVLAVCKQKKFELEDVFKKENCALLILETMQDPGNIGTVFRTAEAAGFDAVIMDKNSADIYNPKVIRSAMGAINRLMHIYTDDLYSSIKRLKEKKVRIYAAHLKGEAYYDEVSYKGASAFLIGNESRGLSKEISALADELIKIPLHKNVESLNAAVAASVLMYELERQRRHEHE